MKKALALILALTLLVPVCGIFASAEEDLKLTIVTDMHYSAADTTTPVTASTPEDPWGYVVSNGKMTAESSAIIDEFLAQAAKNDSKYLIVTGDSSDTGAEADVAGISAKLEEFERTSGKTVFALIGNHEHAFKVGMSNARFKQYYANLGYDKAIAVDPDSCSYTADLDGKYRLIAIDSNGFGDARIAWIGEQVAQAKADGKKLISLTHFSVFPHYKAQQLIHESIIDESGALAEKFIDWGIKFNFSGHTHELDTAVYETEKGQLYDIVSGALTTYPCCYRTATFGAKTVDIDTKYITKIDASAVPTGMQEECVKLMKSDFRAYAKKLFEEGAYKEIGNYISAPFLINALGLDRTDDAVLCDLLNSVVPKLKEALTMPLYGENSLSAIATASGIDIPASSYGTLLSAGVELYAAHCAGDEDMPIYNNTTRVALNALAAALAYALADLTAEDYAKLIDFAANKAGVADKIPADLTKLAADAVSRADGIELLVMYAVSPIIEDFTVDAEPDDAKVTLPAYGYVANAGYNFIAKFSTFFSKLISFFTMILSVLNLR